MNCPSLPRPAVVQSVRCRVATQAARVTGFWGRQSGAEGGLLRVLRFPLLLIHSTDCTTILTIYHRELVQQANK
jgi:hypothetical protein